MTRKIPTSEASTMNVWNGDVSAATPPITNSTPTTMCSHRHPSRRPACMSSSTPPKISQIATTTPIATAES